MICQDQQQDHDKEKPEPATAIVAGSVEGSATPVSEAAQQGEWAEQMRTSQELLSAWQPR